MSVHYENARTCFRLRKCWTVEIVIEAASYETSCSRIYVCPTRMRLSAVLLKGSGEKRKWFYSYIYLFTDIRNTGSFNGVDPRATLGSARVLRFEERSFRGSHRGRSSDILRADLISGSPPWQEMLESGEPTTANDIESRRGTSCESSVADRHDLPSEWECVFVAIQYDDLSKNRVVATINGQYQPGIFVLAV